MSISAALSNALSGLTTASRSAEMVSTNIANAATEGYATRSLATSPRSGGGVAILGVTRGLDLALLGDRRLADAEESMTGDILAALTKTEKLFGTPLDPSSLSSHMTAFETALIDAASQPDSSVRLNRAVETANGLAAKIRSLSDGVQDARSAADRQIADQVAALNQDLEQVRQMNSQIVTAKSLGTDVSALLDQRQSVIDRIATITPVREVPRDFGAVALFSTGGAILLDITAAKVDFAPVNLVTADMSLPAGTLSGLTINGKSVPTDPQIGHLRGGSLDAAFQLRDQDLPAVQENLDKLAIDLMGRFADPGLDLTRAAGQPALFTDNGSPLDPAMATGLAGRLSLNAAVDPSQGGAVRLLRDGLGATVPGSVGDATLLQKMSDVIAQRRIPAAASPGTSPISLPELAAGIFSDLALQRQFAEQRQSYATARADSLKNAERANGVDTDDQLQRLLQIEQAYAANARVIQTIGDMIDSLLRI